MKNKWLLVLLAGLLLLVIAMPVSDKKNQETKEELTKSDTGEKEKYEKITPKKAASELEKVISRMEGAGKVKVMMTVSSSSEKVVEKDEETAEDEKQRTKNETTVYEETTVGQTPYVKKELVPTVEGVVVLCEGGDQPVVVQEITEAVEALFSVESHKIKVVKMK